MFPMRLIGGTIAVFVLSLFLFGRVAMKPHAEYVLVPSTLP